MQPQHPARRDPLSTSTNTPADQQLVATAWEYALRSAEGRRVLGELERLQVRIDVVDETGSKPAVIGTFWGTPGSRGVISLERAAIQDPVRAAILLVHEARHALPGGDEAAAEASEALVRAQLRGL